MTKKKADGKITEQIEGKQQEQFCCNNSINSSEIRAAYQHTDTHTTQTLFAFFSYPNRTLVKVNQKLQPQNAADLRRSPQFPETASVCLCLSLSSFRAEFHFWSLDRKHTIFHWTATRSSSDRKTKQLDASVMNLSKVLVLSEALVFLVLSPFLLCDALEREVDMKADEDASLEYSMMANNANDIDFYNVSSDKSRNIAVDDIHSRSKRFIAFPVGSSFSVSFI